MFQYFARKQGEGGYPILIGNIIPFTKGAWYA
jgi:hypothetical protein